MSVVPDPNHVGRFGDESATDFPSKSNKNGGDSAGSSLSANKETLCNSLR